MHDGDTLTSGKQILLAEGGCHIRHRTCSLCNLRSLFDSGFFKDRMDISGWFAVLGQLMADIVQFFRLLTVEFNTIINQHVFQKVIKFLFSDSGFMVFKIIDRIIKLLFPFHKCIEYSLVLWIFPDVSIHNRLKILGSGIHRLILGEKSSVDLTVLVGILDGTSAAHGAADRIASRNGIELCHRHRSSRDDLSQRRKCIFRNTV